MKRLPAIVLIAYLFIIAVPSIVRGQSASSGAIVGTITEATGGVIVNAQVELLGLGTNISNRAVSNESGQYTFPNLPPGDYRITVAAAGFRKTTLELKVVVGRSALGDLVLEVGELGQTVEVKSGARAELQTIDSSIGDTLGGREILRLPTSQRNALELAHLQVATLPATGTSGQYYGRGGAVGGIRGDQNSIVLDGIDATERFTSASRGMSSLDLPVDAIEEFRSTTANPNAITGATSSGGAFTFATRRGTNEIHGAVYGYHQNDNLNANSWTRNRQRQANPELKDNRYGFRVGGPIIRDRTFLFGFFEGRRFPRSADAVRLVPTQEFSQGILRFRDGANNIVSYNLATSQLCGPARTLACDPRGIGISPLIRDYLRLYPAGNDPTLGDELNIVGLRAPVDASSTAETAIARLDHNFSENWRFAGSFIYQRQRSTTSGQLEIDRNVTGGAGLLPLEGSPRDPRHVTMSLTGQITATFSNELRVGWNRQDFGTTAALPRVQLAAAGVPLDLGATLLDDPGDPPANRARPQTTRQRHYTIIDNATWVNGNHIVQFGFSTERRNFFNSRPDRLPLSTSPIANIRTGGFVIIPAAQRPPTCSGTSQTNCLRSGDVARWNTLYGTLLGIWDNTQMLVIRDGSGRPTGELFASNDSLSWHTELRGMDTWRVNRSLTINYGANILIETPWADRNNREYFITDATSGALINPREVLARKAEAAERGAVFNPQIAYTPRERLGRGMYDRVFEIGPRAGASWNPSFSDGVLGRLFGDRKSVLRGGYSLLFDRVLATVTITSQISSNEILNSSANIIAPTCERQGTPGPGCVPGSSPFRIGVDGLPSVPQASPTVPIPFIPASRAPGQAFGVTAARAIDPNFAVGRVHGVNLTLQRELPGDIVMEMGWIGRYGRRLPATFNINAVPVNLRDPSGASSQTFAQAFDAVAAELRRGVVPAQVAPQPWFENLFGANQTRAIAAAAASNFIAGQVGALVVNTLDPRLTALGRPNINNQQFDRMSWQTSGSWSNYNAFFTTFSKRLARGLSFNANWTWSHGLDTASNSADANGAAWTNPYDPSFDYASSLADVRHVFKLYGSYDLPFARSNKLLGGWYTSFIYIARTGLPVSVSQGGDIFGSAAIFGSTTESVPGIGRVESRSGVNNGIAGSGGVATNGNAATGGSGLNLFANPEAVYNNLRHFLISQDKRSQRGSLRGLGFWNLDMSIGKSTGIGERVQVTFSADFFNIFNHTVFNDPSLSLLSPAAFGVISSQLTGNPARGDFAGPRRVQFGLRVDF